VTQLDTHDWVGPVLQCGPLADAVIAAIKSCNATVELIDRGAYVRVLAPQRCVVTRAAIETAAARAFRLPGELEAIMSSFKGRLRIDEDQAVWELSGP
jgi:toluene monooxygenase system protein D